MKKLFLIVATTSLLSFTYAFKSYNETDSKVGIYEQKKSGSLLLRVNVKKEEGQAFVIKLVNEQGHLMYSDKSKKSGEAVLFNFDFINAKSGEYQLIVNSRNQEVKKEILKIYNSLSY